MERIPAETELQTRAKEVLKHDFMLWVKQKGWLVPEDDPWAGMPQSALADDGSGRSTAVQRSQWRDVRIARVKQWIDTGAITTLLEIRTYTCSVEEAKECAAYLRERQSCAASVTRSASTPHQYPRLDLD